MYSPKMGSKGGVKLENQKDFLEALKVQIEANLASHERTPGPLHMSKQDEFDLGQFSTQKRFEKELSKKTGLNVKEIIHNAAPAILYDLIIYPLSYAAGTPAFGAPRSP